MNNTIDILKSKNVPDNNVLWFMNLMERTHMTTVNENSSLFFIQNRTVIAEKDNEGVILHYNKLWVPLKNHQNMSYEKRLEIIIESFYRKFNITVFSPTFSCFSNENVWNEIEKKI